jgi:hypothetical protein
VDGDHVGVPELGGSVGLAPEVLLEDLVVGEGRFQDLERDVDVEIRVARPVNVGKPALTKELVDPIDRDMAAQKYVTFQNAPLPPYDPGLKPPKKPSVSGLYIVSPYRP